MQRRHVLSLALLPLLAPVRESGAFPLIGTSSTKPIVKVIEVPSLCQGRLRDQDFVAVRYVGRFEDGTPFDERYETSPLIYELGSGFYLPGVDEALEGQCVGTKLLFSWKSSPSLGPEFEKLLPPGSPVEIAMSVDSIRYSLFGEKMRNPRNKYWFAEQPFSLTSPVDSRGHLSSRDVRVGKENPFSIAPGEKSIISNPSSTLVPLFEGFFGDSSSGS